MKGKAERMKALQTQHALPAADLLGMSDTFSINLPFSGSSLVSVGKEGREKNIWNSRTQEKKRREVGFVHLGPPSGGRHGLACTVAQPVSETSGSQPGNQPRPIQRSKKERDRMENRKWHSRSVQTEPRTTPTRSPLQFVSFPSTLFLIS